MLFPPGGKLFRSAVSKRGTAYAFVGIVRRIVPPGGDVITFSCPWSFIRIRSLHRKRCCKVSGKFCCLSLEFGSKWCPEASAYQPPVNSGLGGSDSFQQTGRCVSPKNSESRHRPASDGIRLRSCWRAIPDRLSISPGDSLDVYNPNGHLSRHESGIGEGRRNPGQCNAILVLGLPPIGRLVLVVAEVILLLHFLSPPVDCLSHVAD